LLIPAPKNLSKDVTREDYYEIYGEMLKRYKSKNR
jgi:hypothetical protein